jgi:uncharacterized repeat protein (TIGR01451 family)
VSHPEGNAGDTPFGFTISLSEAASSPVSVAYQTADGTAQAGSDYAASSGTVTFAPGETSQTITVSVHGDTNPENDETFVVNLSNPSGATIADGQGIGTIVDDDLPALSIDDVTHLEGNAGNTAFVFTVKLSAPSPVPVSVAYTTVKGSATSPSDFAVSAGTLDFAPNQTSRTIAVLAHGDTVFEPDETFAVVLSRPSHATIADATGVGKIVNDDPAANLSVTKTISPSAPTVGDDSVYTITISNKGPSAATTIAVTDSLPLTMLYASSPRSCTVTPATKSAGAVVHCTIAQLASGAHTTVAIAVVPLAAGATRNTVAVTSKIFDPTTSDNTFTLTTNVASAPHVVNDSGTPSCTVRGTNDADTIVGPAVPSHICAGAGNDTITAGGQGDVIDAGPGNDVIDARNGRIDTVDGGPGYDTCICDPSDHTTNIERRTSQ